MKLHRPLPPAAIALIAAAGLVRPERAHADACIQVPVPCVVTSAFGGRLDPITKNYSSEFHQGVDFGCPLNTPDTAAAGGIVLVSGFSQSAGNWVVIRSPGNGPTIKYMHHERLAVSVGNMVNAGQVIAYTGNTGRSTGPHMHFQVEVANKAIDPMAQFCSKPGLKAGVLQGALPAQADNITPGTQGTPPDSGPAPSMALSGSVNEVLGDVVASRALNPDYMRQLSTLSTPRLYAELAYMQTIDLKVQHEQSEHRERILATQAMLEMLRADSGMRPQIEAQRAQVQQAAVAAVRR